MILASSSAVIGSLSGAMPTSSGVFLMVNAPITPNTTVMPPVMATPRGRPNLAMSQFSR